MDNLSKKKNNHDLESKMDIINQSDAIFQYVTEGILITNHLGEIIKINPSAEKIFGYDAGELLGQKIEILIPNKYRHSHVAQRDGFHQSPHARSMGQGLALSGIRKDGIEFPVEVSLSPYSNSHGKFIIAFVIDITIRKKAEKALVAYKTKLEEEVEDRTLILKEAIKKLEQTKNELDNALTRERELNSMKSRFISIASHEFRTPLAAIMSSLSLVEKYGDMGAIEKRDKHIGRIKNSVRNLTDILNDFLSLQKLEEGKVVINAEWFDFADFIEIMKTEIVGILKPGQKVVSECLPEEDCKVCLDAKLLRHIVLNLLSNAIKFSPENSTVLLRAEINSEHITFLVKDQGIGIPPSDQKHLFERFFRSSNAGEIQGTGLGLSIVAQYTSLLQGKVSFKSAENKGTEFYIQLPRNIENVHHLTNFL